VTVKLNISGSTNGAAVKVTVLDEQLRELPGYTPKIAPARSNPDSRNKSSGAGIDKSPPTPIRIRVDFTGVRPEDLQLYADLCSDGAIGSFGIKLMVIGSGAIGATKPATARVEPRDRRAKAAASTFKIVTTRW